MTVPSSGPPVRVLVAASSPVVRAGLEALLGASASVTVVGVAAGDAAAVAEHAERLRPDVVLVEVEPGGADDEGEDRPHAPPAALLAALAAHGGESSSSAPSPAAVLLVPDADDAGHWAPAALRAGVRAVLPRTASAAEIALAVESAAAGLVVLHPEVAAAPLAAAVHADAADQRAPASRAALPDEPAGGPSLTPREIEVLGMLAEGLGNKQIAPRLGITEHTVKYHVASIFAKLGASSRTE
ncbi:MAG TPA: response regulator transcription factor, partial [Gemmatimonadaceae bacterium]|nr:response regulator transcription factor [Gemmatimonadaceae bacterium]